MTQTAEQPNAHIATLPPVLSSTHDGQAVTLYRVKNNDGKDYDLVCNNQTLHSFTAWQYHVLSALFSFGGDQYATLLGNVNDRFGTQLAQADIDTFFSDLAWRNLFDKTNAPGHPLIAPFLGAGKKAPAISINTAQANGNVKDAGKADLWHSKDIFNPTPYLKTIQPALSYAGYLAYALPFMTLAAIIILWGYTPEAEHDLTALLPGFTIVTGTIISLLSVNALTVFALAAVAYSYGATVRSIQMIFYFGFLPRFAVTPEDTEKLSKRQKMWLYATPILVHVGMFSFATLVWYAGRPLQGFLPQFFATVAFISGHSLLIIACPFFKTSGYRLLAEFLGDPEIRDKAFISLLNKWKKNAYARIDSNVLSAYALSCIVFIAAIGIDILLCLHSFLNIQLGTKSLVVITALISMIGIRLYAKISEISKAYEQRLQFERWRRHVAPVDLKAEEEKQKEKNKSDQPGTSAYYFKRALIAAGVVMLLLPYAYHANGVVELSPAAQQQISTDISGIVDQVYYNGGEALKKGTVVARLSTRDQQSQLDITIAKLEEQKAYIEQLKAKLNVATMKSSYSENKYNRQKQLFDSHSISLDALESVESVYAVNKEEVIQIQAEILTAESALPGLEAQVKMYADQIERSALKMPFDGKLTTLNLQEKKGLFIEKGTPFSIAEDDSSYEVMLTVPETDAPHIAVGAPVNVHLQAHPGRTFRGTVKTIDPSVQEETYGKMIRVIATLEPDPNILKAGMTGYAKVTGDRMMLWQILSLSTYRFITVEMWAWVP